MTTPAHANQEFGEQKTKAKRMLVACEDVGIIDWTGGVADTRDASRLQLESGRH